jgi:hypothetical protein
MKGMQRSAKIRKDPQRSKDLKDLKDLEDLEDLGFDL